MSRIGSRSLILRSLSVSSSAKILKVISIVFRTVPKMQWVQTPIHKGDPKRKELNKEKNKSGWIEECMEGIFDFLCLQT